MRLHTALGQILVSLYHGLVYHSVPGRHVQASVHVQSKIPEEVYARQHVLIGLDDELVVRAAHHEVVELLVLQPQLVEQLLAGGLVRDAEIGVPRGLGALGYKRVGLVEIFSILLISLVRIREQARRTASASTATRKSSSAM